MDKYLFFLGHQPHLSLAELESVYGTNSFLQKTKKLAIMELTNKPDIDILGGTKKISKIVFEKSINEAEQKNAPWMVKQIIDSTQNYLISYCTEQNIRRLSFGFSFYGGGNPGLLNQKDIQKVLANLRRSIKKVNSDVKLQTISQNGGLKTELSTAEIVHSGLLKKKGMHLDFILMEGKLVLAETIGLPNLRRYTLRDYHKPKPSGFNGMLPPKLAQIMINLSGVKSTDVILDPFCGSGTVLQECLMRNLQCVGSDLSKQIVKDAGENLDWLSKKFRIDTSYRLIAGSTDATNQQWSESFKHVVCETFLGTPLVREPRPETMSKVMSEPDRIAEGFLRNIHPQLKKNGAGSRIVIALPCWFVRGEFNRLPVVEKLDAIGYNLVKFKVNTDFGASEDNKDDLNGLIYIRKNRTDQSGKDLGSQIVGRDIYVLEVK